MKTTKKNVETLNKNRNVNEKKNLVKKTQKKILETVNKEKISEKTIEEKDINVYDMTKDLNVEV